MYKKNNEEENKKHESEFVVISNLTGPRNERTDFLDWCSDFGYLPTSITWDYWQNWNKGFVDLNETEWKQLIDLFTYTNAGKRVNQNAMSIILSWRHKIDLTTKEEDPNDEKCVDRVTYDYKD